MIELSDALKARSKGITAAYPSETRYSLITEEALNSLDFINLMVYDYTGPWNPSPSQHSSYNHAKLGINFWKNTVGVNPSKLTLGVPFMVMIFKIQQLLNHSHMARWLIPMFLTLKKITLETNTIMVDQRLLIKLNWHLKI